MKLFRTTTVLIFLFLLPVSLLSQTENVDLSIIYKIKQEGLKNSGVEEMAFGLTDLVGPRLTGSSGNNRGNEWAKKKMEELGLKNVRIEAAHEFTRGGWDNLKTYAAMTAPYYANLACNPVAWTGSTNGVVKSEVILLEIKDESELEKFRGKLQGKIILMASGEAYEVSYEPLASRLTDEQLKDIASVSSSSSSRGRRTYDYASMSAQRTLRVKIASFLKSEGAAIVLNNSGTFNVPRSNGANYTAGNPEPVAELNLAVENHGRIERLLRHNIPVEMEIEVQNKFLDSPQVYNVIGEIPGTDKLLKNEVVLVGAHLDSWHGGTGAADNASGCVVMLEALRIIQSLGISPKRTIRIALWGGEEQGLFGSSGYVEKYLLNSETKEQKPEFEKFAGYFNMDNGTGKYRGIYLQENELVRPIFEEWLKPFNDMGASTVTIRNTSGTDHLSFDRAGLPGFQFIQDGIEYGRGYHTVMDTYERLVMSDLKHNAIITASFVYNAAMRNEKLPRKPVMNTLPAPVRRRD